MYEELLNDHARLLGWLFAECWGIISIEKIGNSKILIWLIDGEGRKCYMLVKRQKTCRVRFIHNFTFTLRPSRRYPRAWLPWLTFQFTINLCRSIHHTAAVQRGFFSTCLAFVIFDTYFWCNLYEVVSICFLKLSRCFHCGARNIRIKNSGEVCDFLYVH